MATSSVSSSSGTTSQLVDQLVYLDGAPIRTNEAKIKALEAKKKTIQDINTKVLSLQTATKDLYKALTKGEKAVTASKENIANVTITDDTLTGNLSLNVKQLATNLVVGGDKFSGEIGIDGTFDITLGEKTATIEVKSTDTVESLRKKINSNKELGLSANIVDGRLTLSAKESGTNTISFSDNNGILEKIGMVDSTGTAKNVLQEGKNALFTLNGIDIERSSNTISDAVEGMTIKLQDVGDVSFNVEEDVDKLVESFESFVKAYNDVLDTVNTELTKEGGSLRGDTTLAKLKTNLRTALNSFGKSNFKDLSEIGLEMSSTNYGKNAKLEIDDKDKLKDALLSNKSDLLDLLFTDNNDDGKLDLEDTGIFGTLNKFLDDATSTKGKFKGALALKIESIESSVRSLEERNSRLETSLEKKRKMYEKQFLYMDQMVSSYNDMGMSLIGMMGTSY